MSSAGNQLYRDRADPADAVSRRGTQLLEIGSTHGKPRYLDGEWCVALGGTLLAVNDDP
jgi:hypothetical protein